MIEPSPTPVFDRDGMLRRLLNDETLAKALAAEFVKDTQDQLTAAISALSRGALAETVRNVHTIKGAAGIVGGTDLARAAAEAEAAAKGGDVEATRRGLDDVSSRFAVLREALATAW